MSEEAKKETVEFPYRVASPEFFFLLQRIDRLDEQLSARIDTCGLSVNRSNFQIDRQGFHFKKPARKRIIVRKSKEQVEFLAEINTANIVARYPDDLKSALKKYNRKLASEYLKKTKDVIKCIKKELE